MKKKEYEITDDYSCTKGKKTPLSLGRQKYCIFCIVRIQEYMLGCVLLLGIHVC